MPENKTSSSEHVAQMVRQCLKEGKSVEIDGLGVFQPNSAGQSTHPSPISANTPSSAVCR